MSKAKFAYQRLYGDSMKETAVGDYIKELEENNAKILKALITHASDDYLSFEEAWRIIEDVTGEPRETFTE